jgi:hypothetical protein
MRKGEINRHVTFMEMRNKYKILVDKIERKKKFKECMCR